MDSRVCSLTADWERLSPHNLSLMPKDLMFGLPPEEATVPR